jgi:hypothetical protein
MGRDALTYRSSECLLHTPHDTSPTLAESQPLKPSFIRLCHKLSSFCGQADMEKLSGGCRAWHARTVQAIGFKGTHFPKAVILHAVFFYARCAVSYRDFEEFLAEHEGGCRSRDAEPLGGQVFCLDRNLHALERGQRGVMPLGHPGAVTGLFHQLERGWKKFTKSRANSVAAAMPAYLR